jgi:hypothetical protein
MAMNTYKARRHGRIILGVFLTLLFAVPGWLVPLAKAQNSVHSFRTLHAPGRLVSEGTNSTPIGELGIKTYRLEEVTLAQPYEGDWRGRKVKFEYVVRLTVTGEKFRQGSWVIWIDSQALTLVSIEPKAMVAIIPDTSILEDGATISVGEYSHPGTPPKPRWTLPERLHRPTVLSAYESPRGAECGITQIRPASRKSSVEIIVKSDIPFEFRNGLYALQIGDSEFTEGGIPFDDTRFERKHYLFILSEAEFAKLKDGDTVLLKHDPGPGVGQKLGHLNKSMLRH